MAKYRKKPVVVEAEQWWNMESDVKDVEQYLHPHTDEDSEELSCGYCGNTLANHGWVNTLEGGHIVCPGDFIITGIVGEKYPCKPGIFADTYEAV